MPRDGVTTNIGGIEELKEERLGDINGALGTLGALVGDGTSSGSAVGGDADGAAAEGAAVGLSAHQLRRDSDDRLGRRVLGTASALADSEVGDLTTVGLAATTVGGGVGSLAGGSRRRRSLSGGLLNHGGSGGGGRLGRRSVGAGRAGGGGRDVDRAGRGRRRSGRGGSGGRLLGLRLGSLNSDGVLSVSAVLVNDDSGSLEDGDGLGVGDKSTLLVKVGVAVVRLGGGNAEEGAESNSRLHDENEWKALDAKTGEIRYVKAEPCCSTVGSVLRRKCEESCSNGRILINE